MRWLYLPAAGEGKPRDALFTRRMQFGLADAAGPRMMQVIAYWQRKEGNHHT
jgi:hypothetical protein